MKCTITAQFNLMRVNLMRDDGRGGGRLQV
jgi:hypothetical protein